MKKNIIILVVLLLILIIALAVYFLFRPTQPPVSIIFKPDNNVKRSFNDVEMSNGNYIVTEMNSIDENSRLLRISPKGAMTVITTYSGQLRGLTTDGSDFIATGIDPSGGNVLLRIAQNGTTSIIASSISGGGALTDVAVLGSDYIVADPANERLLRITPDGTVSTFASSPGGYLRGIKAVNNEIIVAGGYGECLGRLYRVSADGTVSIIASETTLYICSAYSSVAPDGSDFIVNSGSNTGFKRIKPDGTIIDIINPDIGLATGPVGLLVRGTDIIVADGSPATLFRIAIP
ncbi:MAG: hypothetical protein PHU56_01510 [Candidatus Pacebacteria bacterium]|nr:hypothetical protein [Candidatus Paceibacterota bacterium]